MSTSPASIVRERLVGDCTLGVLRITLASTPSGFVVASERTGAPSTRTASAPSGFDAAAARFDALVSAAVEVSL